MTSATAHILCKSTDDFYRRNAASFSATRAHAWTGWQRCIDSIDVPSNLSVLDIGCGNLRFEKFLLQQCPQNVLQVCAVDVCDSLLPQPLPPQVSFVHFDVCRALIEEQSLAEIPAPPCNLSACFGLFHHVPQQRNRCRLLNYLVSATRPGGYVLVSLWRFMADATLAEKARTTTPRGLVALGLQPHQLETDDYLLGWKDVPDSFRYCHHFADDEIDGLVASVAACATPVVRFRADGRTGDLNTYLVLKVKDAPFAEEA